MAIFKTADPDEKAQANAESALRSKRRDRDGLIERLGISEAAAVSYRQKARALAGEGGDDAAIAKLEAQMRASQDRALTLAGAITDIDQVIAGVEREIEQIIDRRCRRETSAAVDTMATRLAGAQAAHQAAALELEEAAKEGGILIPESQAVHQFVLSMREQLAPAVEMIVGALKGHARGVLSGHAPASLPGPAAKPVELRVVPQEPTTNVFVTRNIRYVASGGDVVCCGQNRRHDLPERIAKLALASGAALPLTDRKHIEAFEGTSGMYVPTPQACEWIGAKGKEPAPLTGGAPVYHSTPPSPFTPMDRGPAFSVPIARGPEPVAVGQRSAEDDQS